MEHTPKIVDQWSCNGNMHEHFPQLPEGEILDRYAVVDYWKYMVTIIRAGKDGKRYALGRDYFSRPAVLWCLD